MTETVQWRCGFCGHEEEHNKYQDTLAMTRNSYIRCSKCNHRLMPKSSAYRRQIFGYDPLGDPDKSLWKKPFFEESEEIQK